MTKNIHFKKQKGFTLVESLVAITVFLIVVTITGSIYISFVRQERRLYAFLRTENNIRFALDYIGRDIRMAKSYDFTENITEGGAISLDFIDYMGKDTTYTLDNKNISVSHNGELLLLPLLDDTIEVKFLRFYITDGAMGVSQPTVIIALEATDKNTGFDYSLETAITPRNLNFDITP
jgi:prepilin-type N-terminal cleavage/methylation domain-containing protein